MNGPVKSVTRPHVVSSAAVGAALQRHRVMASQFPSSDGTGAATVIMSAIGLVVLAAAAGMFFLSSPQEEPAAAQAPVALEEQQPVAGAEARVPAAAERVPEPVFQTAGTDVEAAEMPPALPNAADVAAILSDHDSGGASVVAVAETVEELLALEEIQSREVEADLARTSDEITAAIQPETGPKVSAAATTWVNMRSGPSDDAEVLMVVPGGADIEAETGCNWCAVSYDGRAGYIYKSFISYR